jgi:VWFA-related protein
MILQSALRFNSVAPAQGRHLRNIATRLNPKPQADVKRPVRGFISSLTIVWILFSSAVHGYQIRARVDLVVVPASVRDSRGKLVAGLTAKDFTVFEDGMPQAISNFSDDPQPLSAAILVDTGMGGISMRRLVPLFIAVTSGFSEFDEMASFRFDHFVVRLSDFTADHEKIEKSFDVVKTIAEKQPATVESGTPAPTAPKIVQLLLGLLKNGGGYGGAVDGTRSPTETLPTVGSKRVEPSRVLLDALHDAAKALETRPANRRKILFVVSDGQVSGNTHTFDEVTRLLLKDEIELYAVSTDSAALEGRFGVLGSLAKATGGEEFRGLTTSAMENAFSRITEQARNQYVLGYHSTQTPPEGLPVVRTIEVKGRDPRWKITHRKGYTQIP